ncbi:hypothetical protein GCM10009625_24840 [Brachybacterium fresconis]
MGSIMSEFLKLKRSMSWSVVVLLPIIMVVAGSGSTIAVEGEFADGWHTLWVRSIGFYGMAILPVGIAILASLVWRVEHKNSNWNALMSRPVPTWQIVVGKIAAISILAAVMQIVLVAAVIGLGKFVFGLPGMLPTDYLITSLLIIAAQVPVVAFQSALSTFARSFAAPVAIALVLTGASTMALLLKIPGVAVTPYALLTRTTQTGSATMLTGQGTSFDVSALTPDVVGLTIGLSAVLAVVVIAGTSIILNHTDTRT